MAVVLPIVSAQLNAAQSNVESQSANPTVDLPGFEVASVKPDKSGFGPRILLTADGLTATKVTVKFLIKEAYGVEDDEISGAPNWLDSETYDVDAKVSSADLAALEKLDERQRMRMLQPLLAERFQLKVRRQHLRKFRCMHLSSPRMVPNSTRQSRAILTLTESRVLTVNPADVRA